MGRSVNAAEWALVIGVLLGALFGYGWGRQVGVLTERQRRLRAGR